MMPSTPEMNKSLTMLIHGESKVGKALALSTPILTDSGWKNMATVSVGDAVHTADGSLTPVVAVSDVMSGRTCYRVTTRSGASVIADSEHLWTMTDGRVLTTEQMLLSGLRKESRYRFRLPVAEELDREDCALPIDPYLLGLWLGNGGTSNSLLHCHSADADHYVMAAHAAGFLASVRSVRGNAAAITVSDGVKHGSPEGRSATFQGVLRAIGLLGNKHIPDSYLTASAKQRRALLQGLLDSDGYAATHDNGSGHVEFSSTLRDLAEGVLLLARTLGVKARLVLKTATLNGRVIGDAYRVTFAASRADELFTAPRKQNALPERLTSPRTRVDAVVSIEPVTSVPVRCITVEHVSGLFLAGRGLVVTHNSTLAVTAPYPRLMVDAEGGHKFLSIVPKYWDPAREAPPEADGTWDTCVVQATAFDDMLRTYQWLQTGKHQFASLIVDSISELQVKAIEQLSGREQMQMQSWGALLRTTTGLMRDLRDLTMLPVNPLRAVVLTAMTSDKGGMKRPYLQGQSSVTAPYLFDVTGYLVVDEFPNPDPTQPPIRLRRLHIAPSHEYMAGERVGGRLGAVVEQENLSVEKMIDIVYGTTATTTTSTKEKK
jgi:hypothetical protein